MYDPLIFSQYIDLARAVLVQYERDRLKEYEKLLKKKEMLVNSISTDSNFYKDKVRNIWKSWELDKRNYEYFCAWEKSEWAEFWKDVANIQIETRHQLNLNQPKTKKGIIYD